jgi:glycosyltransferase involved in cell wall biosynthesis
MRIAYVTTDPGIPAFGTKGASVHVQEMLRAFQKLGHEVTLFSPRVSESPTAKIPGVQLRPLPPAPRGVDADARSAWALSTNDTVDAILAAEGPFDLVYERHALFAHAAMEFAARQGIPSALELNAPLIEEQAKHRALSRRAEAEASARRAFQAAGLVAGVSPVAASYARSFGAHPSRVVVEPNGVDASRFVEPPAMQGPFTVGFVGTLKPWHDTGTLIEAFAVLRRDLVHDARLLMVGDGPERVRIEARIKELGLAEATRFSGAVQASEVPSWLARMHAATAPYHGNRPFYFSPLKLFEYMAASLPVVASDVGNLSQVLDNGRLGLLVPPDDPSALAAKLAALADDPGLRERLGVAARAQVVANHSWDGIAARIIARASSKAREAA